MKYILTLLFVFVCFSNIFAQSYNEIVNRSVKYDGLIPTYKDKEDYYFEFNNRIKNKYFILYSTNLTSIDNLGIFAGFPMSQMVMKFQEVKGAYNLVQIGTQILPDTSKFSNYNQEVTSRFGPIKIDFKQNESDSANRLCKINQFFEGDIPNLAYEFQQMFGGYYMINMDMTYIENVKTFPNNIEIFVNYVFTSQGGPNANVPDSRSINFKVRYSLIEIPENKNYISRYNDDRVGYFTSDFKDYSRPNRPTEYTSYINRWDLRKKDPYTELSEPVKPIVYYIDRATPLEYREPIRKGVLLWNKAFENIGFKNAVECRVQEDTAKWDVEDIRYNVIRWQSSSSSGLAGVGPSLANPFTGEIINASVLLNSEIVSYLRSERELISSLALTKPEEYFYNNNEQKFFKHNKCSDKFCNYANHSKIYVANALTAIKINNNITADENSELIQQFINDYLTDLVVHEVGHTLGLRHNFKASSAYTFAQIRDSNFTKNNATGSSVMDYNSVNLSAPGLPQGQYWSGTVGNYDLFAIEYGYKIFSDIKNPNDEVPFLLAVASKSQDPLNVYGTDEDVYDAFGPTSLDPLTQQFDLGNSPLEYAKEKIVISEDLLKKIQNHYPQYDRSFIQLSRVFRGLLFDYLSSIGYAAKYVGGAYVTRMKSGDFMGTKYPYQPVSSQEQMQALELVSEYLFHADRHLNFSPEFLQLLQPNTASVWEGQSRLDVPINEIILSYQKFYLQRFYNNILTGRMLQQEKVSSNSLPLAAMFDFIKTNIWSELKNSESFSSTRKNLQKAHLDILIALVVTPYYGTPEEARSLAYYDLNNLKREISLKRSNSIYDEFHLKECASRIDKALNSVFIDQNN
jgi:hypothetical protein